jgi:hypothetical protein
MAKILSVLTREQLVRVTVTRPTQTAGGVGGQLVESTVDVVTPWMKFEKLSGGQAQRVFGNQSKARWRGVGDHDLDIQKDDLIEILTGPYAGTVLQADDIRVPNNFLSVISFVDTDKVPS